MSRKQNDVEVALDYALDDARVYLVINDLHGHFVDKRCWKIILAYIKKIRPYGVIILGDLTDFWKISRWDKDPGRVDSLQDELWFVGDLLNELVETVTLYCLQRYAVPPDIRYVEGNHEERLRKYLWNKAHELASLKVLDIRELLPLNKHGIKYYPVLGSDEMPAETCRIGDLFFVHGDIVRKHAGYSAKAMYEKYGVSLIHGHTHRDGKYTHRTKLANWAVWENYCLCDLNPPYLSHADWSQGFSVVTFVGDRPFVEQVPIINGKSIYGGEVLIC